MKSVSGQLAATLSGNVHLGANLFTFFLDTALRLTDAGMDIVYDASDGLGAQTYLSSAAAVKRGRSKLSLSVAPDDVEITLALGSLANGTNIRLAAVRGNFDGRRVRVQKLYSTWFAGDTTTGAVTDVDGPGYVADVSSAELRLVVKSRTDLLSRPLPPRVIAPSCQWVLYGAGCLADLPTHSDTRTLASGSTTSSLITTASTVKATGLVYFTSGPNVGVQRNVNLAATSGTIIAPTVPFPYAPSAGETIVVVRGCDRTRATCDGTFGNLAHFGGMPDVPDAVPKVTT